MTLYQAQYGKLSTLRAEIAGLSAIRNLTEVERRFLADLRRILKTRQGK